MKIGTALGFLATALLLLNVQGRGQVPQGPQPVVIPSTLQPVDRGIMRGPSDPASPRLRVSGVDGDGVVLNRVREPQSAYVRDRVIVKFRSASADAKERSVRDVSRTGRLIQRTGSPGFDEIQLDAGEDAVTVARTLATRADVEYAQPAYRVYTRFVPNDTYYKQLQWNFPAIDLERGWDIQRGSSSSVIVAVLDSGMAYRTATVQYFAPAFSVNGVVYPALGNVNVPFTRGVDLAVPGAAGDSRFVSPHDFIWNSSTPFDLDDVGHGTHVSGTIGELANNNLGVAGVAFNVRLMPLKVVDSTWDVIFGAPNEGSDATVAAAIIYAADNGAKVLNMSIGRSGGAAPTVEDAVRYAIGKGCFIAVAGGNTFPSNDFEVFAEMASRIDGMVAVGATAQGHLHAPYSTASPYIEVSAPGGSDAAPVYQEAYDYTLVETYLLPPAQYKAPRFDTTVLLGLEGTSMATPHVTGLAALLMQQGVTNPVAIEKALKQFATDLGTPGRDNQFGYGEINARATLRGLGLTR